MLEGEGTITCGGVQPDVGLKAVKLSAGDSVVVQRVKDTFYIVGKVN